MSIEDEILEIFEEIDFLEKELEGLLLETGTLSEIQRLAIWTNLNRIKFLKKRINELLK
ncbi:MAG: hypothetical protein AAGJ18_12100 [Bacteroidota bacterium]